MENQTLQRYLSYLQQDPNNTNLLLSINEMLESLESSNEILVLKARILQRLQRFEDSIQLICSVQGFEHNEELLGLLATAYFELEDEQQALHFTKASLALNPVHEDARMLMLFLDQQTSLGDIESFLAMHPSSYRLWYRLGIKQLEEHQLLDAQKSFERSIEYHQHFYQAWLGLGWCHLLMNDADKAWHCYQSATQIEPTLSDAWSGLALVAILNKQWREAAESINKAREMNPQCAMLGLAEALLASHDRSEAA
ncbi:methyltransferase [Legionella birminghamensis]|uniref:Methyltransferase n=1 Tax=Legionella birminghamensis TaxID=28083 RepID=A0A378IB02_9GAMM|nr:tetratricopeptide repeat protein [Legionella birminghamensis]KTC71746.1 methyltransferase [Legionella birminghamensis]STX32417.1 methyltransferase [Legionella birminghamensis]